MYFWDLYDDPRLSRKARIENFRAGFGLSNKPKHLKYKENLPHFHFNGFYMSVILMLILIILFLLAL